MPWCRSVFRRAALLAIHCCACIRNATRASISLSGFFAPGIVAGKPRLRTIACAELNIPTFFGYGSNDTVICHAGTVRDCRAWLDEHTFLTAKSYRGLDHSVSPMEEFSDFARIGSPRTTSRRGSCKSRPVEHVGSVGDVGLVEVHVGTARGRDRAGPDSANRCVAEPYGCSAGELSWKKHIWPIFMPGHSFTGSVDTLDNSSVI